VHTPFDKAAIITARCEMLLSPGTVISMSIRGARFTRNSIDKKKPLVDTQYVMFDKTRARANLAPNTGIQHRPRTPSRQPVTEQEKSYPCTDLLLPFPEGSLLHRYICQVSKDSRRGEVCQEREFHTDNPPSRSSSVRLLVEVKLLRSPQVAYL